VAGRFGCGQPVYRALSAASLPTVWGARLVAATCVALSLAACSSAAQRATATLPSASHMAAPSPSTISPSRPVASAAAPTAAQRSSPILGASVGGTSASVAPTEVAAAYAAGRAFYSAEAHAFATFDTAPLIAATTDDCDCRAKVMKQVVNARSKGEVFKGGSFESLSLGSFLTAGGGFAQISATYDIESGSIIGKAGEVVLHQPTFSGWQDSLTLVLSGRKWRVANVQVLAQGKQVE
jgi:hypothetical protein